MHVRDIVNQVYAFAVLQGEKVDNPATDVAAASIATFVPKDRALSPAEIRLAFHQLESIATYPTIRLALRMVLPTLVRKSELIEATWSEIDFEHATWTIPKQRMKRRNPHVVYLSRQALDILVALHTCAAGSKFVLPSRSVYNKAEYAEQRRHMLQEWADMIDAWIDGRTHVPKLLPENVPVPMLSAAL